MIQNEIRFKMAKEFGKVEIMIPKNPNSRCRVVMQGISKLKRDPRAVGRRRRG
jgi:hypothetical protein